MSWCGLGRRCPALKLRLFICIHFSSFASLAAFAFAWSVAAQDSLPGTAPLTIEGDLAARMVDGINGYLVVGTIWFYMHAAGYPIGDYFTAPDRNTELGQAAIELLEHMPPVYLDPPLIYFAVAIAFLFVVVVFI